MRHAHALLLVFSHPPLWVAAATSNMSSPFVVRWGIVGCGGMHLSVHLLSEGEERTELIDPIDRNRHLQEVHKGTLSTHCTIPL